MYHTVLGGNVQVSQVNERHEMLGQGYSKCQTHLVIHVRHIRDGVDL